MWCSRQCLCVRVCVLERVRVCVSGVCSSVVVCAVCMVCGVWCVVCVVCGVFVVRACVFECANECVCERNFLSASV